MFVWNMVGALVLIPALSHFLLNDRHFQRAAAAKPSAAGHLLALAERGG